MTDPTVDDLERQIVALYGVPGPALGQSRQDSARVAYVKHMRKLGYFGEADALDWRAYEAALESALAADRRSP